MINTLLARFGRSYLVWRCPICYKLRRTITKIREGHPPMCLHHYTPFEMYVRGVMKQESKR